MFREGYSLNFEYPCENRCVNHFDFANEFGVNVGQNRRGEYHFRATGTIWRFCRFQNDFFFMRASKWVRPIQKKDTHSIAESSSVKIKDEALNSDEVIYWQNTHEIQNPQ